MSFLLTRFTPQTNPPIRPTRSTSSTRTPTQAPTSNSCCSRSAKRETKGSKGGQRRRRGTHSETTQKTRRSRQAAGKVQARAGTASVAGVTTRGKKEHGRCVPTQTATTTTKTTTMAPSSNRGLLPPSMSICHPSLPPRTLPGPPLSAPHRTSCSVWNCLLPKSLRPCWPSVCGPTLLLRHRRSQANRIQGDATKQPPQQQLQQR